MKNWILAIALLVAVAATAFVLVGCKADKPVSTNRATTFVLWSDQHAQCEDYYSGPALVGNGSASTSVVNEDEALCTIAGVRHWCRATPGNPPGCQPYGAPQPEPAKPATADAAPPPAQPAPTAEAAPKK
jgi:hypothetical protein